MNDGGKLETVQGKNIYDVFDKMFVCELNLSWEWMHRWHPEYPAHVSELECFPWVRTRITRLQKIGCNHSTTWVDPYSDVSYHLLRSVVTNL